MQSGGLEGFSEENPDAQHKVPHIIKCDLVTEEWD